MDRLLVSPTQKIRRASLERMSGFDLNLNPTDAFLLSRIDGRVTVGEILQLSPEPEAEAKASLAGLICAGVALVEGIEKPRSATAEIQRSQMVRLAGRLHASDPHEVLGVKATAAKLKIGAESVKSHRESACRKLGVDGVTAAAVVLTKAGLV